MNRLTALQQALVEQALEEFTFVAKAFAKRYRRARLEDMLSAVHLELTELVLTFDPKKGTSFNGYAYKAVVGAMMNAAGLEDKQLAWKVAGALFHGEIADQRAAEAAQAAAAPAGLELPAHDAPEPRQIVAGRLRSRAGVIAMRLAVTLHATGGESEQIDRIDWNRAWQVVEGAITTLDIREQRTLRGIYYEELPLNQIADEVGVSVRHVQRIHEEAREKLGRALQRAGLALSQRR
ncbi:MAG: sigma-70 family RNA polymerase sigma factor [Polyangiaceae bacterium]|nr:sigma-70 family RNA polymerase sigma factor [Polyangiaceae bacterium]